MRTLQLGALAATVLLSPLFCQDPTPPAPPVPPQPAPPQPVPATRPPVVVEVKLPPPRVGAERATAIQAALHWLAKHQDEDGRWDCDEFMKHDPAGAAGCAGPGNAVHDVGATAIAVLAFLGDGSTTKAGPWQTNLQRAAKWLSDQQHDNGRFGTTASHDFVYDHAIAAYAVCELFGSGTATLRETAQQGVNYLESHRNPYAVWRYQPRDNDNDTSVTTWAVLALASAERHALTVNREALKLAGVWYDQVSDRSGRHGYSKQGEPSSRKPGNHAQRFPPERGEAMTAAAVTGRFAIGQTPATTPVLMPAADLLAAKPPQWEADRIDPIYWFFGARALQQIGGPHHDTWQKGLDALLPKQRQDGGCAGSWDPVGVWDEDGGRVVTTALCALALQTAVPQAPRPK